MELSAIHTLTVLPPVGALPVPIGQEAKWAPGSVWTLQREKKSVTCSRKYIGTRVRVCDISIRAFPSNYPVDVLLLYAIKIVLYCGRDFLVLLREDG
jgi:hypothetical protein